MDGNSRVYAAIDLDAILSNMEAMRGKLSKHTEIMAVVKADGYGHGAAKVAEAIGGLDYVYGFGVATPEEGLSLRRHGITKPILVLGYTFPEQYGDMIRAGIRPTVFTRRMAEDLSETAGRIGMDCRIHFAVDTGMGRIGYPVTAEAADEMARLSCLPHIMVEGIFTHFARADERDKAHARAQLALFGKMDAMLRERGLFIPIRHCSNSAGILELPEANMDMVRAGITMYGLWPSEEMDREGISLKPALSLHARVAYVKELPSESAISYGGTYVTEEPRVIATIPVGYADGYARGLSNKGTVLIHGKRAPIRGRICMDQFMADVTDIPGVSCGDEVVLIGRDGEECITLEELGELSGRFNYEFACCIGKRVPRVYIHGQKALPNIVAEAL